jgi:hypothetical protein
MGNLMPAQRDELNSIFKRLESNVYLSGDEGYWSNLNRDENRELINSLQEMSTRDAIKRFHPQLFDVIFSPKRWGGLELLEINGTEECIDYGCMWGALTIGLAKRCKYVLGVDQTLESLRFLSVRTKEDGLENVDLLCADLKNIRKFDKKFNVAIVNGVLEWIPEEGKIELKAYFGKRSQKSYSSNPRSKQVAFLKRVYENLSTGGKIYLSIENRFDLKVFMGAKDPHANILFTSFLPRNLANAVSIRKLGRPYVNWLYSFKGIKRILTEAGFATVELYMCFPDYRFPEIIIPYSSPLSFNDIRYRLQMIVMPPPGHPIKRMIKKALVYGLGAVNIVLRVNSLAPSIIAIGHK